jgi:hypothetical protein
MEPQSAQPPTMLDHALAWAARGFRIFPLHPGAKVPLFDGWPDLASSDPAVIRAWWRDGLTGHVQPYNIGVCTSGVAVIDLDVKHGRNGKLAFAQAGGRLDTLTVRTPTGGEHLYCQPPHPVPNSAGKIAEGVDIRGERGYVIAPGSVTSNGAYELVHDAPVAPLPPWVAERAGIVAPVARATAPAPDLDTPAATASAAAYLQAAAPAIEGMGGDSRTYQVACEVRDRGVSAPVALDLMLAHWNGRCEPPWRPDELAAKVENAYAYAQRAEGEKSPEAAFGGVQHIPPEHIAQPGAQGTAASVRPRVFAPGVLADDPIPEREWLIPDWLSPGHATGLYGDGGSGKTMLGLQLQIACATGAPWLGLPAVHCRSFALYAEDDTAELRRRHAAICRAHGVPPAATGDDMLAASGVGHDNTLAHFDRDGRLMPTPLLAEIEGIAREHAARLVILDNAAELFGGNENDRREVRQFIGALTGMAQRLNAAVLLLCHPSRSGLASGRLDGASTAWNNGFRSRWTLGKAPMRTAGAPAEMILERPKANYAPSTEAAIRLRWAGRTLLPVITAFGEISGAFTRPPCEDIFLKLLALAERIGQPLSLSGNSGNFAARWMAAREDNEGWSVRDFEGAMHHLFAAGKIRNAAYGRPSAPRHKLEIVPDDGANAE